MVEVKAIWLRRDGDKLKVLFERPDSKWYVAIVEPAPGDTEWTISHICEEAGLRDAKEDDL